MGHFIPQEHSIPAAFTQSLSSHFQELEKLGLGDSVDLHVYEIPVEYKTVQRLIPALWEKHSPQVSGVRQVGAPHVDDLCNFVPAVITWLYHGLVPKRRTFPGYP